MKDLVISLGENRTAVKFVERRNALLFDKNDTFTVFDSNTRPLFNAVTQNSLVLKPGEEEKNWNSVNEILDSALQAGIARDSLFVGAGGGVVCDITAFAASIYMRGTPVVLVPTTLLAMADASIGGKTGIDFSGYKNIAGTFFPAVEVRICMDVIESLPEREYKNGLAEIIKHGMLRDGEILSIMRNYPKKVLERDPAVLADLVRRSIEVKTWYVEQDAKEKGIRAHLNLGHTFGHALESVAGFTECSHGEGVAWGIMKALQAGVKTGETDPVWLEEYAKIAEIYGYNMKLPAGILKKDIISALKKDKKKKESAVQFVLQRKQGDTFMTRLDDSLVMEIL